MQALRQIAGANVSVKAFEGLVSWIDSISKDGLSLGLASELRCNYASGVLESHLEEITKFSNFDQ